MSALVHLALLLVAGGLDVAAVERNAQRLALTPAQQKKVHQVVVEAGARQQKARADIDLAELELQRLLELDAPDEKKVGKLIERLARLQGEVRAAETLGWLRIRAALTRPQREQLEALRVETASAAAAPAPPTAPAGSAAPAPANSGLLSVNTTPPARVLIDGKDTGRMTPARFDLAPGKHTVSLVTSSQRVDSTVDISPGSTVSIVRSLGASSKTDGE